MKQIINGSYALKQAFQNHLNPANNFLVKHRVSPNTVTLLSFFLIVLLVLCLIWEPARTLFLLLTPLFMLLKISCNALDGMLARETNQRTTLGAWLNEITDFFADLLVISAVFVHSSANYAWLVLVLLVFLIEITGLLAQYAQTKRRHFGPFSKSDRAIYISIVALILFLTTNSSLVNSLTIIGIILAIVSWLQQLNYWLAK